MLSEIVERLEKECGFKLLRSSTGPMPHMVFAKEIGDDIHFVSIWNKTNDPKIKDWTIISEMQSGITVPYELTFKEFELFREFINLLKRGF